MPKSRRRKGKRKPARRKLVAELARATGFSGRTLYRYLADGWDGDPETLQAWREQNLGRPGRRPLVPRFDRPDPIREGAKAELDLDGEQRRDWAEAYRRAKTLKAELELDEARKRVLPREDVERMWVSRVAEVRAALMFLPRKLARRLQSQTARVIEAELDSECRAILERFARGDSVMRTPAAKKRKRKASG